MKILADTSQLQKGFSQADNAATKMGKGMKTVGTKMSTFVTLPLLGAGAAAIKFAADAGEIENKMKVVFGGMSDDVSKWSETSIEKMGIAKATAQDMASTFGLLFQAAKLPKPAVTSLSKDFTTLAVDMSSFFNIPFEEALATLRSGLVGETEPLRRFGVLLSESALGAEALRLGLIKEGQVMTEQQKVVARSSVIMNSLKKAQGDYARTSDSVANKQRTMKERLKETAATIGQRLLPLADKLLSMGEKLLSWFTNMSPAAQDLTLKIAGIALVSGPLLRIFGPLVGLAGKLGGAFFQMGKAAAVATPAIAGIGTNAGGAVGKVSKLKGFLGGLAGLGVAAVIGGIAYGFAKMAAEAAIVRQKINTMFKDLVTGAKSGREAMDDLGFNFDELAGKARRGEKLTIDEAQALMIAEKAYKRVIATQKNQSKGLDTLNEVLLDHNKTLTAGEKNSIRSAIATGNTALAHKLLAREVKEAKAAIDAQGRGLDALSSKKPNEAHARAMEKIAEMAQKAKKAVDDAATAHETLAGRKPAQLEIGAKVRLTDAEKALNVFLAKWRNRQIVVDVQAREGGGPPPPGGNKPGGNKPGGNKPPPFKPPPGVTQGAVLTKAVTVPVTVYSGPTRFDIERAAVQAVRKALNQRRTL